MGIEPTPKRDSRLVAHKPAGHELTLAESGDFRERNSRQQMILGRQGAPCQLVKPHQRGLGSFSSLPVTRANILHG
jgi:hypothetical protein